MHKWGDIVSQLIDEAIRQGVFDNLPGPDKPLEIQRNPFLPEEQQMAVTLLRNNKLTLEWISERQAILATIENAREAFAHTVHALPDALRQPTDAKIGEQLRQWQDRIQKLNDRILVHNLKQPVTHLEILQLRLSDELKRAGTGNDSAK